MERWSNAATLLALETAAQALDPDLVAQHLNQRFASAGVSFTANDISRWIDGNGDGLVGEFFFEVTGASSSTTFAFPAYLATALNGKSIYMNGGELIVNNVPVTGNVTIHTGDVIAVRPGTFDNGAYVASIHSGNYFGVARVTFIAPLDSIEVSPQDERMAVDAQQSFTATGHFSDGSVGNLSSRVRWTSSAPNIATVDGIGLVEALAIGTTTISATIGSYSGSSELDVVAVVLEDFTISPVSMNTGVGVVQKPGATGTYSDGTIGDVTHLVTWSSNDPLVATVDAQGAITGVALGSTEIEATIESLTHSLPVNVTASGVELGQPMAVGRRSHSATRLANGKVLVTGGESSETTAEIYDPATATWSSAGNMPNRHGNHEATLLSDGRVFVTGGTGAGPAVPFAELYDPTTNQWSSATQMSLDRVDHTSTVLLNGKVLVVGGNGGLGPIHASTVLYDPATNTWSTRANLGTQRAIHTATRLANGKVLVTGGRDAISVRDTVSSLTATAELYDPESDTWSPVASMLHARLGHTATLCFPTERCWWWADWTRRRRSFRKSYDPDFEYLVAGRHDDAYYALAHGNFAGQRHRHGCGRHD